MTLTSEQVRTALGNQAAWDELIAPTEQARAAMLILREMAKQARYVKHRKGAELAAVQEARNAGRVTQEQAHEALTSYTAWRRSHEGFQRLLSQRIGELEARMAGVNNTDVRRRAVEAQRVMEALALTIDAHRRGHVTDADLWSALDAFHFGFGKHGRLSLAQAIEADLISEVDERVYAY